MSKNLSQSVDNGSARVETVFFQNSAVDLKTKKGIPPADNLPVSMAVGYLDITLPRNQSSPYVKDPNFRSQSKTVEGYLESKYLKK